MPNQDQKFNQLKINFVIGSVFLFFGIIFGAITEEIGNRAYYPGHQIFVGIAALFILLSFLELIKHYRNHHLLRTLLMFAILLLVIQILLGIYLGANQATEWVTGLHYSISMIIFGLLIGSLAYLTIINSTNNSKNLNFSSKFSKHALVGVFLGFIVMLSGIFLSVDGVRDACTSWPLCTPGNFPKTNSQWIVFIHRIFVGVVGLFLYSFHRQAWKKQKSQRLILSASNLYVVLYFAQGYVGAMKTIQDFPIYMLVLHEITAVAFIAVGIILLISIGVMGRSEGEEAFEASLPLNRRQRIKDLLTINKPVVVSLLLTTTVAGMIIGAGKFPEMDIFIVTVVAGFLAAGGSSAINQYIDRDLDRMMTRTANRPIPAGRLTPAEGLAFGITALVIAFYLLAGLVNILSALLALAGMIYYVVIYSIFLKKRSVQNIVIGGGAGAIPPLVGWAAATGTLNLAAFFLFVIIFLWTPPHFWALALLRKNEYENAGVPMMPVERGVAITKKLIFQYTIVLVFSSLTLWFLKFAGWLYLIGALSLGIYLIILANQVLVNGRNRVYFRMYRHSSYYLLLLFIFLAADSVLL